MPTPPRPPASPPPSSSSSGSGLTRKVGPFPLWVWVAGVGGVAFFMYRQRTSSASPSSLDGVTGTTTNPGTDTGLLPDVSGPTSPPDIDDWAQRAFKALVQAGVNPGNASGSIYDYINGNQLSTTERNIIDRALRIIGMPPEILPFPVVTPPHPAPKPPAHSGTPPPPIARKGLTIPDFEPVHGSPQPTFTEKEARTTQSNIAALASRYGVKLPTGDALRALVIKNFPTFAKAGDRQQFVDVTASELKFIQNQANLKQPTDAQVLAGAQYLAKTSGQSWASMGTADQAAAKQNSRVLLLQQLNPVRAR